jgi:serine/threonine-protein phosphatase 6 regulatory ankyrin repeat subunit B
MNVLKSCLYLLFLSLTIAFPFESFPTAWANPAAEEGKRQTSLSAPLITGDLYAVIVGVSNYRDSKIPRLDLSDKDARAFGDFLKTQNEIFKETRVTYLLNEKATKLEIEKQLYYTLPKAGKEDTIILFFSGHGAFDPVRPTEFLFLPYDAEPDYLGATGVKMSGLEFLKGVNAERVLIIADACYAGGFSEMKAKSVSPSVEMFLREVRSSSGRAIITSGTEKQLSWEAPNAKNSVFTHNLLEGLRGKADKDKNGIVSLDEAYQYAYARTKEETGGRQHPQKEEKIVGAFPLSFVGSRVPHGQLKKAFLKTAESGDETAFQQLAPRVDIEARDDENNTPLILASAGGHVNIVKALLEKRADVEASNHSRAVALSYASEKGHAEIVQMLLAAGAQVNVKNADGMTPLSLAATNGHVKVAESLLEEGADLKARANNGDTALSLAASHGHVEMVKSLLKWGDGTRPEDLNADGALTVAARGGHAEIVKLLIPKTGGVRLRNCGPTERRLALAVLRGDLKAVKETTERSGSVECRTEAGDSPLELASALGNKEIVKHLLSKGANVHTRRDGETTALMAAAKNGHTDVVAQLISAGADVNAADKDGMTVLALAAAKGQSESVKLLLSKSCQVTAKSGSGVTALHAAARAGHTEVVRLLISGGSDVNAADNEGATALMDAAAAGHLEVARLLASKDADVNAKNSQRRTALIMAATNGQKAVVKFLLSRGADTGVEDWEGKTALTLASERNLQEIIEILKSN